MFGFNFRDAKQLTPVSRIYLPDHLAAHRQSCVILPEDMTSCLSRYQQGLESSFIDEYLPTALNAPSYSHHPCTTRSYFPLPTMYSSAIHVIHVTNWFLLMDHNASFHSMRICPGRSLSLSPGLVNGTPRVAFLVTYSWHTAWK